MEDNKYYTQMMALPGLADVKAEISKWNKALSNIDGRGIHVPRFLPNLYLQAMPGAGKSNFVRLLSEYLFSLGSMNFYGDVKFFEFYLGYCEIGAQMTELTRFIQQLQNCAGYRNEYQGVIVLDITEWADHVEEEHFVLFLDYLEMIDTSCCLIFTSDRASEAQAAQIEKVLSAFCRVRRVSFAYPQAEDFVLVCADYLKDYQVQLDESAKILLKDVLEKLMQSDYFDGYKTVQKLCLDIAFEVVSSGKAAQQLASAADLQAFSSESEFVTRLCTTAKRSRIGFGGN